MECIPYSAAVKVDIPDNMGGRTPCSVEARKLFSLFLLHLSYKRCFSDEGQVGSFRWYEIRY